GALGRKVGFFDFREFFFDLFVGDRDAHFVGLAPDPDPFDLFGQGGFLDFFVFFAARFRRLFEFRAIDLEGEGAVEFLLAYGAEIFGGVLDLDDVARGNARGADSLRDREADEEHDEKGAEEDQPQALTAGRSIPVPSGFSSLTSFSSHAAGSIIKSPPLSRL